MAGSRKSHSRSSSSAGPLACPTCARRYGEEERFCGDCGMPLVRSGGAILEEPRDERHERARKIRPEYTRGELVRVAGGRNQAEAELIQNLLLEEGVPSLLRRSPGFDVPDFLAAGPRDVLVPAAGADVAREMLLEVDPVEPPLPSRRSSRADRLVGVGLLIALALIACFAWVGIELVV